MSLLTDEEVKEIRLSVPAVCTHADLIRHTEKFIEAKLEQGKRDAVPEGIHKDAERYQYIKRTTGASRDGFHNIYIDLPERWARGSIAQHYEEAIDAAIAAAPKQEK